MGNQERESSGLTFFIERSAGQQFIADSLRKLGRQVILHEKVCSHNDRDEVWLERCGKNRWIAITRDGNVYKNPLELAAIRDAEAAVFVITQGTATNPEMAEILRENIAVIEEYANKNVPPYVVAVTKGGLRVRYDLTMNTERVFQKRFKKARRLKRGS